MQNQNSANMHKKLDTFIQDSLNKFYFTKPEDELNNINFTDKPSIISFKSTIPDLVIYNKSFNKNECFQDSNLSSKNPFPRYKFYLNLDKSSKQSNDSTIVQESNSILSSKNLNEIPSNSNNLKDNTSSKICQREPAKIESNKNIDIMINELRNYQNQNKSDLNKKEKNNEMNINKNSYITMKTNKKTMNDYYQDQFKKNEFLINYVYSYMDVKGWAIFQSNGMYIANFTSFELFSFLTDMLKEQNELKLFVVGMNNNSIMFNGEQIYIILSQTLPFILQKKQKEFMQTKNQKNKNLDCNENNEAKKKVNSVADNRIKNNCDFTQDKENMSDNVNNLLSGKFH